MNDMHEKHSLRGDIMDVIQKRGIQMRPRWHFVAFSVFAIVGIFLVVLTLLYVASLAVFFMRESGVWFVPAFGVRGWYALLRSLPWLLILLIVVFVILLEVLVQRYSFVYKKPLVASVLGVALLVACGGFFIGRTSLHRELFRHARHNELPFPFGLWYQAPFRIPRSGEVHHGTIVATSSNGFVITDIDDEEGTSTVIITPQTRLPYGADFSDGDSVVVFGDRIATDTVRAFGVREIED